MTNTAAPARRYDLDWLRVGAFGLLILYHVGMFYVPWGWHVKSPRILDWLQWPMLFVNPWRMLLLFFISGVATRFMADRMGGFSFLGQRMGRLIPPLIMAMAIIVPPQSYFQILEVLNQLGMPASPVLDGFYGKYITGTGEWCNDDGCLTTPTYNHLWFVAFLIPYTVLLFVLLPVVRRLPAVLGGLLRGPGVILVPWAVLFAARVTLFPAYGESHDVFDSPYLHTIYLATFLFGAAVAKGETVFRSAVQMRWLALGVGLGVYAGLMIYYATTKETPPLGILVVARGARELQAVCFLVAIVGFAHHALKDRSGPRLTLATAMVFPFYIMHQTAIVVSGFLLAPIGMPLWLEVTAIMVSVLAACWLFYEIGVRAGPFKVFFGVPGPLSWRQRIK